MKNVKYIALVLVVALALVGGAYAYWTDTLEIQADIDTADVNIEYTSIALWGIKPQESKPDPYMSGKHYNAGVFKGKKAKFEIHNMYPMKDDYGKKPQLSMRADNLGVLPVKLKDVKLNLSHDREHSVWDYVKAEVNVRHYVKNENGNFNQVGGKVTKKGLLRNLDYLMKEAAKDLVIQHDEVIAFGELDADGELVPGCIEIWLAENTPNEFQNVSFGFDVEMIFEQANLVN